MFDAIIKITYKKEVLFVDLDGKIAKTQVRHADGTEYIINADGRILMLHEIHIISVRTWTETKIIEYDY